MTTVGEMLLAQVLRERTLKFAKFVRRETEQQMRFVESQIVNSVLRGKKDEEIEPLKARYERLLNLAKTTYSPLGLDTDLTEFTKVPVEEICELLELHIGNIRYELEQKEQEVSN